MKGSFFYGSSMKKNKPTYDEAFDNMETTVDRNTGRKYKINKRADKMYVDSDVGRKLFKEEAQLYNAKQKNKNVTRVARKKATKVSSVDKPRHSTMSKIPEYVDSTSSSKSKRTRKKFKDTKVGKFLSKKRTNQPRKKYNPRLNRFE